MAVTDPVSEMLTRIRNATMMNHSDVNIPTSKLKVEIEYKISKEINEELPEINFESKLHALR